jgi:hypothetical protein
MTHPASDLETRRDSGLPDHSLDREQAADQGRIIRFEFPFSTRLRQSNFRATVSSTSQNVRSADQNRESYAKMRDEISLLTGEEIQSDTWQN